MKPDAGTMQRRTALATLAVIAAGCTREPQAGGRYLATLSDAIRGADRIVITEHSYPLDAYDADKGKSLLPESIIYKTVELSPMQKAAFLSAIAPLDPRTQDAFPACIFEPHHTIHFHADGNLRSTLQVCFQCGQVEWDGSAETPPWSLYAGLGSAIRAVGLEPERDWRALALARLESMPRQPSDAAKIQAP
jgi:hypothetical protein